MSLADEKAFLQRLHARAQERKSRESLGLDLDLYYALDEFVQRIFVSLPEWKKEALIAEFVEID